MATTATADIEGVYFLAEILCPVFIFCNCFRCAKIKTIFQQLFIIKIMF